VEELRIATGNTVQSDGGYDLKAAELGWFAMLVPSELGGGSVSDSALADAAMVSMERGAWLQPGPFMPVNVVVDTLARAGTDTHKREVVPALASGEVTACWAVADRQGNWEPGRAVRWRPDGQDFVLTGAASFVEEAQGAAWVLVAAGSEQGVTDFLVPVSAPGIEIEALNGLDLTRRFYAVEFRDVRVAQSGITGGIGSGSTLADRQLQVAAVFTVADAVGAMSRDFEMVVDYAKKHMAFGRPIGSFQAVKHLLANTSLLLESSKAILTAAIDADGTVDAGRFAGVAKAFVGDSAIELGQNCLQVLGGIGFTWEHEHHLYMRRMVTDAMLYGDPNWHRERLCASYGLAGAVGP